MFTSDEIQLLISAIDQAIASQKRAQNSSKNPKLMPIYQAIQNELEAIKVKLNSPTLTLASSKPNK